MSSVTSNVTSIHQGGPATLKDADAWIANFKKKGEMGSSSARLRSTAIRNLATVLADDEPKDVAYFLEHLDSIEQRWATLNPDKKGDTARTYASRARTTLEAFLKWRQDPSGFRFSRASTGTPAKKTPRTKASEAATTGDPEPISPTAPPAGASETASGPKRSFPLDADGHEFEFSLPRRPLTMRDVRRIAIHLASYSVDFDPGSPTDEQVFGLAHIR